MFGLSPGETIGIGGVAVAGWGLAAYFFRLVYTGKLVPSHDRDEWRAESRIKDQQIHELTEQNTAMLQEFGPTVTAFMQSLHQATDLGQVGKS